MQVNYDPETNYFTMTLTDGNDVDLAHDLIHSFRKDLGKETIWPQNNPKSADQLIKLSGRER